MKNERDRFLFPSAKAADKFARSVRENEALDVVRATRSRDWVTVEHCGHPFDGGYLLGMAHGMGGDSA